MRASSCRCCLHFVHEYGSLEGDAMKVDIDLAADAAAIQWAQRAPGRSKLFSQPGGRGVRLYFSDAGDVVGMEVLGWSKRTDTPTDVQVVVHSSDEGEILGEDHR